MQFRYAVDYIIYFTLTPALFAGREPCFAPVFRRARAAAFLQAQNPDPRSFPRKFAISE